MLPELRGGILGGLGDKGGKTRRGLPGAPLVFLRRSILVSRTRTQYTAVHGQTGVNIT